jgi:PAS domain S-box-containing protein
MAAVPNGSEVRNDDRFEERFRRMVEDSPAILWAFDEVNGRMIYVNPAVEEALGHDRRKFYERSTFWLELIHADDRAEAAAANHVMRTEKRPIQFQTRSRAAAGGYIQLCTAVRPILDERGNIVRTEGAAIPKYE